MIRSAFRPTALAAGLLALAGCGGVAEPTPLKGTVSLGGKLLARVTLTLVSEGTGDSLNGSSDDQGAFALLPPAGKAVAAGGYKVVVVDPNPKGKGGRADDPYAADLKGAASNPPIPAKYGRADTTTAKVTVEVGKPLAIDLAP